MVRRGRHSCWSPAGAVTNGKQSNRDLVITAVIAIVPSSLMISRVNEWHCRDATQWLRT